MPAPLQQDFNDDWQWVEALRAYVDPLILKMLTDCGDTLPRSLVPAVSEDDSWEPAHAFEDARSRRVIGFDPDMDCYTSPTWGFHAR